MLVSLAVIVFASLSLTGFLKKDNDDQVVLEIEYPNHWNATLTENGSERPLSGFGRVEKVLLRPNEGVWSISVTANKMDDSRSNLTVEVKLRDGTVVKRVSSSEPFGVVELSVDII